MSTSPEAKQAAEEWGNSTTVFREAFAIGYDAATAKSETRCGELREELEAKNETIGVALKIGRRLGKAGVDFDKMTKERWSKIFRDHINELIAENESLRERLAHQQPSTPTKGYRIAGEIVSDAVGEEFGRLIRERDALQSAPTPDVEKIARDWRIVDYGDSIGRVLQEGDNELAVLDTKLAYAKAARLRDWHNEALAQTRALRQDELDAEWDKGFHCSEERYEKARAPFATANLRLVMALRQIAEFNLSGIGSADALVEIRQIARAALTGTGEKLK